ncbi:hypothetical protein MUP29_02410 [bacterium]|nr:hypothetical protein [bacterium]
MKRFTLVIMVLMALPLAFACGGGGGGGGTGGPALTAFEGDWFGPGEDDGFGLTDIFLSINDSGTITIYEQDGAGTGLTPATFVVEDASSALITFPGGADREGGLFWDDTVTHMLFVDTWSGYIGALDKSTDVLPSYATTDAVGTWSGYAYYFDALGSVDWEKDSPVTLTIAADLTFTGTSPDGPFTGTMNAAIFNSSYGHIAGTVTPPVGPELVTSMYLSPDKTFAAGYFVYLETPVYGWPWDYSFLALTKQP